MADQEDRSEAATPRRLQQAREQGNVPVSRELTAFAGLAAVSLAMVMTAPQAVHGLLLRLSIFLAQAHTLNPSLTVARMAGEAWALTVAPIVLAALVAGVAVVLLQTRFLISGHGLQPKFSRISPHAGLGRILSLESAIEAGKSLAKVAVLGFVLWHVLMADLPGLLLAPFGASSQILGRAAGPVLHILFVVLAAQAAIAAIDYFWVSMRHNRNLRMSRQDIQEEQKDTDGDPRIKARLRQIRASRTRKRMLAGVQKATVVVTNPTHYAVALAYDRAKHAAPRVVAKGVDFLAAKIREEAEAHRVPIVANPPLARALYRVEVDADIPAEHYQAVAEIIAYVWKLARRPQQSQAASGD